MPVIPGISLDSQYMPIRDARRRVRKVPDKAKVEPSTWRADVDMELCSSQRDDRSWIWSRRWANASAARPVPGTLFPETSENQDLLATIGMHPVHTGTAAKRATKRRETDVSLILSRCRLHQLFPDPRAFWPGVRYPAQMGSLEGRSCRQIRREVRRTHRSAVYLQSMHHATMHEGLIETCRRL